MHSWNGKIDKVIVQRYRRYVNDSVPQLLPLDGVGFDADIWYAAEASWSFMSPSILYMGGRNVLNPIINSRWSLNKFVTRSITVGAPMLCDLNAFIISKKSL